MNDEFQHEIRRIMVRLERYRCIHSTVARSPKVLAQDYYNANPDADSLSRVQKQLDDVKDVMVENIGAMGLALRWVRWQSRLTSIVRLLYYREGAGSRREV